MSAARRLRVLHVCEPTHAGAARVAFTLADRLRPLGVDPVVCTPPGELAEWCAHAGVPVLGLPFARRRPATWAAAHRVLDAALSGDGYDLVHAHSSFAGVLVRARRGGPPVVFQPHAWSFLALSGTARRASVLVERGLARRTDLLVCVSDDELALGHAAGIRIRSERVILNGVAFDEPAPSAAGSVPGGDPAGTRPPPAPIAGCVARLAPQKGIDVLLRALAEPRWPAGVAVEIVGDGPREAELVALAASLGVADRVRFLGRSDDVAAELHRWALFVLPARYEAGVPIALLEALAAGLPAVVTDVAGVRGLFEAAALAAPLPVDDPAALAAAVGDAFADWPATVRRAHALRAAAARRYSLTAQAEAMAAAYRSLAGG
jgi:glycosyltransferase involved in cell wall biosynthesis